jgi:hypothetical protein
MFVFVKHVTGKIARWLAQYTHIGEGSWGRRKKRKHRNEQRTELTKGFAYGIFEIKIIRAHLPPSRGGGENGNMKT